MSWTRLLVVAALSSAAATHVSAQSSVRQAPNSKEVEGDIVVTAGSKAGLSGTIPAALSVIRGEEIERLRIQNYRDLAFYTPGLYAEAESPGRPFIAIRGIATNSIDAASEPRVSVFQDGVSNSRLQASLTALYDVQRIEVVRGPQSTLFGRSALIGAVSIVTRRADPAASSLYTLSEIGNFGERRFEVTGNTPLGTSSALRLAGQLRHRDGDVADLRGGTDYNGYTTGAARASLHMTRGDVVLDAIGSYEKARDTGASYKSGVFLPADPVTGAVLGDLLPHTGATLGAPAGFPLGKRLGGDRDSFGATVLAEWRLGERLLLSSTGGYRGFRSINRFDYDGFAFDVINGGEAMRGDQFSQELRLAWQGSRLNVLIGASFYDERVYRDSVFSINEPLFTALLTRAIDVRNPVLAPQRQYDDPAATTALIRGLVASAGGSLTAVGAMAVAANFSATHVEGFLHRDRTTAADVFAVGSFLLTPTLEVEAGIRLTTDRKLVRFTSTVPERSVLAGVLASVRLPGGQRDALLTALSVPGAAAIPSSSSYPVPVFGFASQPTSGEDRHVIHDVGPSWRFNLRYEVAPKANIYLTYARGRRPEVISAAAPLSPGGDTVFSDLSAETVDAVEGGMKLRSGAIQFDASTYGYRYRNFQTTVLDRTRPVSIDAGRAHAWGIELEGHWRATRWATLFGTYAWNDARFDTGLYKDNRFRLNPRHTASLGAELFAGALQATPSVVYRSRAFFDDSNGDAALVSTSVLPVVHYMASQSGYALINLQFGYAPTRARWRIDVALQNMADKSYIKDTGQASLAFGLPSYIAGTPRTVTLAFSIRS